MIELIKNFFNQNVYNRIFSGMVFVLPFIYLVLNGGIYFVLFFIFLLVIIINEFYKKTGNKIKFTLRLFAILLFIISFFHFIFLRIAYQEFIVEYLLYIIFSIWVFDSFSLIGGRLFGGRKLMPNISPNKTISGLISGFLSIIIFSIILMFYLNLSNKIILFTLVIGFLSFVGDAIASIYKRFLNIKDFSNIMPGHGGILDRMDAFILIFLVHFLLTILTFNPINYYV